MRGLETVRTDRLVGERLRAEHFDELHRLHQDHRVMATLAGVRSAAETRQMLRANLDHWERHGFGLWLFRDPADGRFVGRGGLRRVHVGGNDEVEVAYALAADSWGRGLATEIARASVAVGFERLGLPDLVCFTLTTNRASRRVMEKAGFGYERDIVHADLPHAFYRLTAAVWRERRAGEGDARRADA